MSGPERIVLAPGLEIPRVVTGLWQVADIERRTGPMDADAAADVLDAYVRDGFDAFDMADHYGSAELIAGRCLARRGGSADRPVMFTKWCPDPGAMTEDVVRAGVEERRHRLGTEKIDLLQFHWWAYEDPAYLDAMRHLQTLRDEGLVAHLGVTNFNTDHLRVLAGEGIDILTNQVSFSLVDRRAADDMAAFCSRTGVRLLAYGTLCGGFLGERWLGKPRPEGGDADTWSRMKYGRFIETAGGWDAFQGLLQVLDRVARSHGASIANVATRWVLDQPHVAAVIVGARLGESEHRADNAAVSTLVLGEADRAALEAAAADLDPVPGDCGDEYRRPPYLTASGDLSHHLDGERQVYLPSAVPERADRARVDTGSIWEEIAGFSRAVRDGNRILVSGTTATHTDGHDVCPDDPAGQCVYILDKIAASLHALGARLEDVVRTRIYIADAGCWEEVSRVHGRYFADIRPANTLVEVAGLIGGYAVEIEAEAVVAES